MLRAKIQSDNYFWRVIQVIQIWFIIPKMQSILSFLSVCSSPPICNRLKYARCAKARASPMPKAWTNWMPAAQIGQQGRRTILLLGCRWTRSDRLTLFRPRRFPELASRALEPVHLLYESVCWTDRILIRTEFLTENLTDFQRDFQTDFKTKNVQIMKKYKWK